MTKANGDVAPGFERVREAFELGFDEGIEVGASFAVFRGARPLVNLWGGFRDRDRTRPWEPDTLINVYSTTKGMAALVCAMLVDRGELDYDAPVSRYWPEFAGRGKQDVSVAMLLSHQAGLSATREPVEALDFCDADRINALLLDQEPLFEPGSASGYHALTFGTLVGELVRRASGRSLGTFFREEVAGPLGVDFHIGLPESEESRVAEMIGPRETPAIASMAENAVQQLAFSNPFTPPEIPNERAWRAAEIPAANGQANAAAIAKVYGALAGGGELDGVRLLGPEALAQATATRITGPDLVLGFEADWGAGYMRNPGGLLYGPNPDAYGHSGYGGSFGCADPVAGLGIGYAMNQMDANLVGDPRPLRLLDAVYACLATA